MIEEGLIVFFSTHDAIKSDNICQEKNFQAALIPTHPSISLGCGFTLKTKWEKFCDLIKRKNKIQSTILFPKKRNKKRNGIII